MEITCNNCNAKLNIPDDKIPRDKAVKINCPKCKKKIVIDPSVDTPDETPATALHNETGKHHLRFIESKRSDEQEDESYDYDDYSDDEALDLFEEDAKIALILADSEEQSEKIKSAVGELGYKSIVTESTRDALGKMRFHNFDLIFLSEGFDGQELRNSPIINYLNNMAMQFRRRLFLALMSEQFKTMDNMMSFSMSANIVINSKDFNKLTPILKKGISDYKKLYKVFMDTLTEMGKA